MSERTYLEYLQRSAIRALKGRISENLFAYSVEISEEEEILTLKSHFLCEPSEDELDDFSVLEGEILADFPSSFDYRPEIEIVSISGFHPLSGGCVYQK